MKATKKTLASTLAFRKGDGFRTSWVLALLSTGAVFACTVEGGEGVDEDTVVLDDNGDLVADDLGGVPLDLNGDGVWDSIDRNGDGVSDGALLDTNGDGIFDAIDSDGDGVGDVKTNLGSGGASQVVDGSGGSNNPIGSGGSGVVVGSGGQVIGNSGGGPGGGGGGEVPTEGGFSESGSMAACTFTINGVPAESMPSVGVVDFSVTGLSGAVTGGVVQFGKDTSYGLAGPVDLAAPGYKTLLLGMRPSMTYHYRIGVSTGSQYCYSEDKTIESGVLRQGVKTIQKSVTGTVAQGFFVAAASSTALIFDQDGEVVWGYTFQAGGAGAVAGIFSAKISYDGKYMIARDLGPFNAGDQGKFFRVGLDGESYSTFDVPGGDHHDFTIIPTGIAYIAKAAAGGYDQIYTAKSDGSGAAPLVDLQPLLDAFPQASGMEKSHVNAIHYWEDRDIYTISNRESDFIGVVSGDGKFVKAIGKAKTGNPSFPTILADGAQGGSGQQVWRVQHGHDLYADNKLLVFSNGAFGGGTSHLLHYTITGETAKLDWQYTAMGNSQTQGDTQMLPNGNVVVIASNAGVMHQINSSQQLQATYSNGGNGFGYVSFRPSLYGPPPPGR